MNEYTIVSCLAIIFTTAVVWYLLFRRSDQAKAMGRTATNAIPIYVTQRQLDAEERLTVPISGAAGPVSVQLRPNMSGRVIRLPGAMSHGLGDVYLRVKVDQSREPTTASVTAENPSHESTCERDLRKSLLNILMGDTAKMQRVMELEKSNFPGSTQVELLQSVVERYRRNR